MWLPRPGRPLLCRSTPGSSSQSWCWWSRWSRSQWLWWCEYWQILGWWWYRWCWWMTMTARIITSMESGCRKENGFGGGGVFFLYRIPTLHNVNQIMPSLFSLSLLVALHLTPVSKWVGEWVVVSEKRHSYIKACISVLGRGLTEFKQMIWFQMRHLSSPIRYAI